MKIDLINESDLDCELSTTEFEAIADDISNKLNLGKPHSIVEVFLVTNDKIKALNRQYRGKDETTDVLSFPQETFATVGEETLGTIFIAPELAKKENIDCESLFTHGFFHLLGFDHETNKNKWRTAEKKVGRNLL